MARPDPCYLDDLERLSRNGPPRWRSPDGKRLYEWDDLHGEIEVYNKQGRHLGALDPVSGEFIKGPVKGRSIEV